MAVPKPRQVACQFVRIGFRALRPSFIHGWSIQVGDNHKTIVKVCYEGEWLDAAYVNSADEAWDLIETFIERIGAGDFDKMGGAESND